jgi:CRP/FNR family transcriptional regulator, cyclic AMP receptor protein
MAVLRERISLVDVRPELTRDLTPDELAELGRASLPGITVDPGQLQLDELLDRHRAFGASVLDGLVMGSLRVGNQFGIHLLGPGDLLPAESQVWPAWLGDLEFRTATPVRLGLFDHDLLIAIHHWPRIVQALYAATGEQLHRLSAQLVICQLPRVEDRVLAMLWLLAESWGHVTPGGVRLPLTLTHETLGSLVGARRPTVTLALRKLTDEGALVSQESGWMLLEPPPAPTEANGTIAPTPPAQLAAGPWSAGSRPGHDQETYAELRDTVQRLREQHRAVYAETRERLRAVRDARARMLASRQRIEQDLLRPRVPPSS